MTAAFSTRQQPALAAFADDADLRIAECGLSLEWNRAYQPRDVDWGTAVFSAAFYATSAPDELIANCRSVLDPIDVEIILYDQVRRLFGDRKDREACPQKR